MRKDSCRKELDIVLFVLSFLGQRGKLSLSLRTQINEKKKCLVCCEFLYSCQRQEGLSWTYAYKVTTAPYAYLHGRVPFSLLLDHCIHFNFQYSTCAVHYFCYFILQTYYLNHKVSASIDLSLQIMQRNRGSSHLVKNSAK